MTNTGLTDSGKKELGPWFWGGLLIGWSVMAFGFWTIFHHKGPDNPTYTFELGFGLNVLHDAIIAPAICVTAFIISKIIPLPLRRPINWALFSSVVVALIAYPAVRGFGRKADNPTIESINYAVALMTVLSVIWTIAVVICAVMVIQRLRYRRNTEGGRPSHAEVPSA